MPTSIFFKDTGVFLESAPYQKIQHVNIGCHIHLINTPEDYRYLSLIIVALYFQILDLACTDARTRHQQIYVPVPDTHLTNQLF